MDTVNNLDNYAKQAIKVITKPVNAFIVFAVISTIFSLNTAHAQSREVMGDTLNGTGFFQTEDIESGEILTQVNLYLTPEQMQMIIPDTTYYFQTGYSGSINYKLPVYIDSVVGIEETSINAPRIFPNFGSEINIVFPKHEKGSVSIYDLSGRLAKQLNFNANNVYLQLLELKAGMYIYSINIESGFTFSGKYLKQNTPAKGSAPSSAVISTTKEEKSPKQLPHSREISQSYLLRNDNGDYEATYWARWEKQDYRTDSMLITIHDGFNTPNIVFPLKTLYDYIWAEGFFVLYDSTTNNDAGGVDLFVWPDSVEMIELDTIYEYVTDYHGIAIFELPAYIDTIPDDTIYGENFAANYWVKWVPEQGPFSGYYTDSTLVHLVDTFQWVHLYIKAVPGIPQNQDITGIAKDDENNNEPLAGVTAILYNQTLDTTITLITGDDGVYFFEDVPLNSECFISVGDLDNYYSWNDIEYTTPSQIEYPEDTIFDQASAVMYAVQPDIQSFPALIQMTSQGTLTGERTYWFDSSVSPSNEAVYVSAYAQYDAQIGGHTHTQTMDEDSADIKICNGLYGTITNSVLVSTPFGDLFPVTDVSMRLNTGQGYGALSHEYGQGDGMNQGGSGYLSSNPPPTGPTAEDIAVDVIDYTHWVENIYGPNNETWFDLNNLRETLYNKSPEFKTPVISTK